MSGNTVASDTIGRQGPGSVVDMCRVYLCARTRETGTDGGGGPVGGPTRQEH